MPTKVVKKVKKVVKKAGATPAKLTTKGKPINEYRMTDRCFRSLTPEVRALALSAIERNALFEMTVGEIAADIIKGGSGSAQDREKAAATFIAAVGAYMAERAASNVGAFKRRADKLRGQKRGSRKAKAAPPAKKAKKARKTVATRRKGR